MKSFPSSVVRLEKPPRLMPLAAVVVVARMAPLLMLSVLAGPFTTNAAAVESSAAPAGAKADDYKAAAKGLSSAVDGLAAGVTAA